MMTEVSQREHRRRTAILLLLVQTVAPALTMAAHAQTRDPLTTIHVEAPGTHPPAHDESACQVCRSAAAPWIPAPAALHAQPGLATHIVPHTAADLAVTFSGRGVAAARAPPGSGHRPHAVA
jgi:hypothetical protein